MFKIESEYTVPNGADGAPFTLADFVKLISLHEPRFSADMTGILACVRLQAKPLEIESGDMSLLRGACDRPQNGYPLQPAHLLAPWLVAIRDAKES